MLRRACGVIMFLRRGWGWRACGSREDEDGEGEEAAGARYAWRVWSLGELAERVEEAFREEGGKGEGGREFDHAVGLGLELRLGLGLGAGS